MLGTKLLAPTAAVAAALLVIIVVQSSRLNAAKAERDSAIAEVSRLVETNVSNQAVIERLQESIVAIRQEAQDQGEAMMNAARVIEGYRDTIADQADRLRAAEEKDYEKSDCQALLATDLTSLCPAHAIGLRERASRRLPRSTD